MKKIEEKEGGGGERGQSHSAEDCASTRAKELHYFRVQIPEILHETSWHYHYYYLPFHYSACAPNHDASFRIKCQLKRQFAFDRPDLVQGG